MNIVSERSRVTAGGIAPDSLRRVQPHLTVCLSSTNDAAWENSRGAPGAPRRALTSHRNESKDEPSRATTAEQVKAIFNHCYPALY